MSAKKKSITTPLHLLHQLSASLLEHLENACSQALIDAEKLLAKLAKQRGKAQEKLHKARSKLQDAAVAGKAKAQAKSKDAVAELEELLDSLAFFPRFEVPPSSSSHKGYLEYIEEQLSTETPAAYGMHPNSEINFMTMQTDAMFAAVAELQPRAAGGGGGMSLQERVKRLLDDIVEKLPDLFPMGELEERSNEDRSPYVGVFL